VRAFERIGDEVEVAQPCAVTEQHPVERREQRGLVQARGVELVATAPAVRRPARLEPRRGALGRERREPRLFEGRGRDGGDALDTVGQAVCIEALRARERRVRRIGADLVGEEIARQVEEGAVA
jgi:hypothetical protein